MAKSRVKKRPDGRYMMQIYLGMVDGKRKYKSVYGATPKEVEAKAEEIRGMMGKGLDIAAQRDKFSQWADDLYRIKAASGVTQGQKQNYYHTIEWWKEQFAPYSISDVRADDIERALLWMQENGYAARTINFYRSVITQIMERAVGRAIQVNPAKLVQLAGMGQPAEKRRALTEEEQQWIWDTPHRAQPAAIIMMLSGLRRGELSALTWADVDTVNQTITVNKTVEYPPDGKAYIRNMTKSAAGMRVVYIPRKLADYLDTLPRSNLLVYPSASGRMMTASAWKAVWQSYMAELNRKYGQRTPADLERMKKPGRHKLDMTIPPITLHWLRHTFCTLMYFAGVDAVQACAQMGHADVTTTLKIYTHLDQQHKRRSMDKLDAYLSDDASQMQVKQK